MDGLLGSKNRTFPVVGKGRGGKLKEKGTVEVNREVCAAAQLLVLWLVAASR